MPEDVAQPDIAKGCLRRVLDDWCPSYSGYHLYYPSRRQATPAFKPSGTDRDRHRLARNEEAPGRDEQQTSRTDRRQSDAIEQRAVLRGTESLLTHRWRKMDSNFWSLA